MEVPISNGLEISKLNKVFEETTNSYKFYWFLAILEMVKQKGTERLSMDDLALHMVANVWYPLDYYKVSFGNDKMDGFKKIATFISDRVVVNHSEKAPDLFDQIKNNLSEKDITHLTLMVKRLLRYVPYRFIRPFFEEILRGLKDAEIANRIKVLCEEKFQSETHRVPYKFEGNYIILNPIWADYFKKHYPILQGFTLWHLTRFLQKYNPNVPGLSEKLFKNNKDRNLKDAYAFWKPFLDETPVFHCIYSGLPLDTVKYSIDHFLPWSFVVHNLLWNLIPTPIHVNSSKGNWLPDWDRYFPDFVERQFKVVNYHLKKGNNKILEDYTNILMGSEITDFKKFNEKLSNQLLPQYQIAKNMGFSHPFIFKV